MFFSVPFTPRDVMAIISFAENADPETVTQEYMEVVRVLIAASPGWQVAHRSWDRRHRVRVVVLAVAALLLIYVVVR